MKNVKKQSHRCVAVEGHADSIANLSIAPREIRLPKIWPEFESNCAINVAAPRLQKDNALKGWRVTKIQTSYSRRDRFEWLQTETFGIFLKNNPCSNTSFDENLQWWKLTGRQAV